MKTKTLSYIKVGITFALMILIGWQIIHFQNNRPLQFTYSNQWIQWFMYTLLLAPVNWLLESMRWRSVMPHRQSISLGTAWRATLSGFTLGLITPARVGDYIGRSIVIPSKSSNAVISTWIAGLCQNWMNISGGLIGLIFLSSLISNQYLIPIFIVTLLLLFILSVLLFHHSWRLSLYKGFLTILKKIFRTITLPEYVTSQNFEYPKGLLFCLSFLRYFIYVTQYLFISRALGVSATPLLLLSSIAVILLLQSFIPLPFIAGMLSRAQISILIWGLIGVDFDKALTVSFTIWVINLLLPALIGLNYVWSLKGSQ